MLGINRNTLRK
ncbi:MAG: hypothetical protein K2Q15_01015, partial [Burkholderiales bacterium]|nr:hypothetical protein [Burkholderiales bacterium]